MTTSANQDYQRIAQTIIYIQTHCREQPSLQQLATNAQLSPNHFQQLLRRWAGISPKKFIQSLSLNFAKHQLTRSNGSLLDTAFNTELSGTERRHDLFVTIEAMTPGEYHTGGQGLTINYQATDSHFGPVLIASTSKGVCHIEFTDNHTPPLKTLVEQFPNATLAPQCDAHQRAVKEFLQHTYTHSTPITLHLQGTSFQIKVWRALLTIPSGELTSYGAIAKDIKQPKSARAVGTAIARNPIAVLIPCHRVIRACGQLGGYKWGEPRKSALISWEAARHGSI